MSTEVQMTVSSWNTDELDDFFSQIDIPNPYLLIKDEKAHWFCRSDYSDIKSARTMESTPVYPIGDRFISTQRIIYILFHHQDPVYKAKIINLCHVSSCVNPSHLTINKDLL